MLDVSDLNLAIEFYARLGFAVGYGRFEEGFVYLERDTAHLMLQAAEVPGRRFRTAELQPPYGRGTNFQLEVSDVGTVHQAVREAGHPRVVADTAAASGRRVRKQTVGSATVNDGTSGDWWPAVELSVRVASDSDVDVLARLRRDWSEESSGGPIDDSTFEAAFAEWFEAERDTRTFFLAELEDTAVGMANVKRYRRMPRPGEPTGSWGYVGNVFISSQHRNVGLGETLMRHIVVWASGEELVHLRLAPSPLSEPFYARLGFRPGSVVEFDPIKA